MKSKVVKVVLAGKDLELLDRAVLELSGAVAWSRSACIRKAVRAFYGKPSVEVTGT